jgi:hypothetical protein
MPLWPIASIVPFLYRGECLSVAFWLYHVTIKTVIGSLNSLPDVILK